MPLKLLIGSHRIGHGGETAHAPIAGHPYEPLRIAKRQGPQQNGIHHAEDRDIGADAQGQDQHGHRCKATVAAQRAQRVPQVLQQDIERRQAARFAMPLLGLRNAAEARQSLAAGFPRREAAPQILFDREFEVCGHLRIELVIHRPFAEKGAQPLERLPERIHHRPSPSPCIPSTRPITPDSLCQ